MFSVRPKTINGCLFWMLGSNDTEQIKYWQKRLNADIAAQAEFGLMAQYALEELVKPLGSEEFGPVRSARLYRQLGEQGFQFGVLEVQRVLDAAVRGSGNDPRVSDNQAVKIRIGLFRLIASVHEVSGDALEDIVSRAEARLPG